MPSRRKFVAACGAGVWLTAGCLGTDSSPNIPRETKILDERATIEPGAYRAWRLSERIESAPLTATADRFVFSYEFVVEDGPPVAVSATTTDEVERRAETGGYQMWGGTRAEGKRGASSEPMPTALLEALLVDNQYVGSETPTPDRNSATVDVRAYLSPHQAD